MQSKQYYNWANMERTYRFRLYPNLKQQDVLNTNIDLCRRLYNSALEHRIIGYRNGKNISFVEQSRELKEIRREFEEYGNIYSHTLQLVLRRLDRAYSNFYRRVKLKRKGDRIKVGFPRFKSYKRFNSMMYDGYGFRLLDNGHLRLTKVGNIRMFKHREIEGEVRTCVIKRDNVGDWWVCISTIILNKPKIIPKTVLGVDVGLMDLVTLSNGEKYEAPRILRKSEEIMKIKQRNLSRKKKGSCNSEKSKLKLAKIHRKIVRQREDYLHKLSNELIDKADVIVFENLNMKNMMKNRHFSKSIQDASWGKLMQYCAYKVENTGKYIDFVDPRNTTQLCSQCGLVVKKSLSERFHICPKCGFSTDRDVNSAINIMRRVGTGCAELYKKPLDVVPLSLGGGKYDR